MGNTIIELLALPQRLFRGEIDIETCSHAGFFLPRDSQCAVCETREECEWLFHNDEVSSLTTKSRGALLDALQTSVFYVDACVTRSQHARYLCTCELCEWLKQARAVLEE